MSSSCIQAPSRLSPKVKGGIITLSAASVLLVSVGAFALAGGFDGQGGSSAQSSSQEAQTTEQGRVTATKVTGEVEASAESETHSKAESDSSEQNGESGSAAGQNADSDSAANGNGGAVDSDTTAGGGFQPSASPWQRARIPNRKLPAPVASSLLRRTSSPYRSRFPAALSAIRVSASGSYSFNAGATPYDALCALGLSVNARSTTYGTYVAAIGGLAEKEHGGSLRLDVLCQRQHAHDCVHQLCALRRRRGRLVLCDRLGKPLFENQGRGAPGLFHQTEMTAA
ncbi:MAG: hypothetical protein V8T51_01510 [Senegalimassilia faecalis]